MTFFAIPACIHVKRVIKSSDSMSCKAEGSGSQCLTVEEQETLGCGVYLWPTCASSVCRQLARPSRAHARGWSGNSSRAILSCSDGA